MPHWTWRLPSPGQASGLLPNRCSGAGAATSETTWASFVCGVGATSSAESSERTIRAVCMGGRQTPWSPGIEKRFRSSGCPSLGEQLELQPPLELHLEQMPRDALGLVALEHV